MLEIRNNRVPLAHKIEFKNTVQQHQNLLNIEIACTYVKLGRWREDDQKVFPGINNVNMRI